MKIFKNILLLLIVLTFSALTAIYVGQLYSAFFQRITGLGGFIASPSIYDFVDGFPLCCVFFLALLFTAFGDKYKYWWISIFATPVLLFEIYFYLLQVYVVLILGILGWLIGFGISKLLVKKFKIKLPN